MGAAIGVATRHCRESVPARNGGNLMKRVIAALLIVSALLAGGASAAVAGEINGNGKWTPIQDGETPADGPNFEDDDYVPSAQRGTAASVCAFSGLEDGDDAPSDVGGPTTPQTPASLGDPGDPGDDCKGTPQGPPAP